MLDISREEITEGRLTRALVVLAIPLVAQNLVQVANQVIDIFWLGRLSDRAVAGVGLVLPLIGILFAIFFLTFVGTQVVVAQRTGNDDMSGARRATFNGLLLALTLGIGTGAVVFVTAGTLIGLFQPDAAVVPFAVPYLATYALGLPLLFLADTMEAGLVGVGDSRGSFYLNLVAMVLNIILDPFLIFGWGPAPALGVRGAALATIIGYTVGFLLAVGLVVRGRQGLRITRQALTVDVSDVREIIDVGSPNTGQRLGRQSARVLMIGIVSVAGGPAGLAAYTIGARVASIAFIPAQGLQQATQSVVGQNLGAGASERARRTTWIGAGIAIIGLGIVGALQWAIPGPITAVFLPEASGMSVAYTTAYLRILAYGYPALGGIYLFLGGFNGARRTRVSMVATLLQYWTVRLPIAAVGVFVLGAGVLAAFWAVTLSNVVGAIGTGIYYRYSARRGMLTRAAERASREVSRSRG